MNSSDSVSVIVPCYKQAHYLPQAIESALESAHQNVEVIVIDDGSPDDTSVVASRYVKSHPERVRLIQQANAGVAAARNNAVLQARGTWIQLLDSDDFLHPDTLSFKLEAAARHPEATVLHGSWQEVDAQSRDLVRVEATPIPNGSRDGFLALFDPLLMGPPCRYLWKRDLIVRAGLFEPTLHPCEDWDFFLRAGAHGAVFLSVPHSVSYYRNYPGSASKNWEKMWRKGRLALKRNAQLFPDDAEVQAAEKRGAQAFRVYCHNVLLVSELSRLRADKRRAVAFALSALRRDPKLLPLLSNAVKVSLRS